MPRPISYAVFCLKKKSLTDFPGEHPEPPRDLADRSPLLSELTPGSAFSRIHCRNEAPVFSARRAGTGLTRRMQTSGYCTLGWMCTVPSSKHSANLLQSAL